MKITVAVPCPGREAGFAGGIAPCLYPKAEGDAHTPTQSWEPCNEPVINPGNTLPDHLAEHNEGEQPVMLQMPLGIPQREMGKRMVPAAGALKRLEEARAGDGRAAASSRVWAGLQPVARGRIQHKGLQKRARGGEEGETQPALRLPSEEQGSPVLRSEQTPGSF